MSAGEVVQLSRAELEEVVSSTVTRTLQTFGVDTSDPIAMQRDFQHLRDWREAVNSAKRKTFLTVLGILVTGALAALFLGIKHYILLG